MRQSIDPKTLYAVVGFGVVLLAAIGIWVWTRPTASASTQVNGAGLPQSSASAPAGVSNTSRHMLEGHQVTDEQRRQIQDWKAKNPGATTKF